MKTEKISHIDFNFSYPMIHDSDTALFEKVKSGDVRAYESLFKAYYARLSHYACSLLLNMEDAEEEVQQLFMRIWDKRADIHIETTFKSYMYRAVKNACLNKIKQKKVYGEHHQRYKMELDQSYESTSQTVLSNELNDMLFDAIEQLPDQCKLVFQMSRLEGLKHQEIADKLNISAKTVENHIGRALKILKVALQGYLSIVMVLCMYVFQK